MTGAKTLPSVPNQINVVIEGIFLMQKTAYSLFGLLAIFSLIAVAPSAFGDHASVTVTNAPGSSTPGCEATNDCFIPSMVTIDVGSEVIWENNDNAAHTVTSGTPTDGPDGVFDSQLVMQAKASLSCFTKQDHMTTFAWFTHGCKEW